MEARTRRKKKEGGGGADVGTGGKAAVAAAAVVSGGGRRERREGGNGLGTTKASSGRGPAKRAKVKPSTMKPPRQRVTLGHVYVVTLASHTSTDFISQNLSSQVKSTTSDMEQRVEQAPEAQRSFSDSGSPPQPGQGREACASTGRQTSSPRCGKRMTDVQQGAGDTDAKTSRKGDKGCAQTRNKAFFADEAIRTTSGAQTSAPVRQSTAPTAATMPSPVAKALDDFEGDALAAFPSAEGANALVRKNLRRCASREDSVVEQTQQCVGGGALLDVVVRGLSRTTRIRAQRMGVSSVEGFVNDLVPGAVVFVTMRCKMSAKGEVDLDTVGVFRSMVTANMRLATLESEGSGWQQEEASLATRYGCKRVSGSCKDGRPLRVWVRKLVLRQTPKR